MQTAGASGSGCAQAFLDRVVTTLKAPRHFTTVLQHIITALVKLLVIAEGVAEGEGGYDKHQTQANMTKKIYIS